MGIWDVPNRLMFSSSCNFTLPRFFWVYFSIPFSTSPKAPISTGIVVAFISFIRSISISKYFSTGIRLFWILLIRSVLVIRDVIYQTQVFHQISKQWGVVWKNKEQPSFFNQLGSVWISGETLFWVLDINSQSINNSKRNSKQQFTEFHDN